MTFFYAVNEIKLFTWELKASVKVIFRVDKTDNTTTLYTVKTTEEHFQKFGKKEFFFSEMFC